jgi:hypothetical protein
MPRPLQHLANQVVQRAIARRGNRILAGAGLGQRHHFGHGVGWERWVRHQHITGCGHRGHGCKVFHRIKAGVLVQRGANHMGAVGRQQQGVAVVARAGRGARGQGATRTRAVFHDHALAQLLAQLLRHHARNRVIGTTCRLRHHQGDGLGRVFVLRARCESGRAQHGRCEDAA